MTVGGQKNDETCLPSVIIYDDLSALDVITNADLLTIPPPSKFAH